MFWDTKIFDRRLLKISENTTNKFKLYHKLFNEKFQQCTKKIIKHKIYFFLYYLATFMVCPIRHVEPCTYEYIHQFHLCSKLCQLANIFKWAKLQAHRSVVFIACRFLGVIIVVSLGKNTLRLL